MFAKTERSSVFHFQLLAFQIQFKKVTNHAECFCIGNYSGIRINLQEICNIGSVIWFHMLYDKVVWLAAIQNLLNIVKPFVGKVCVYSIHNCNLVVQDYIGIIRHSIGNLVLPLEQVNLVVINAYIFDAVCDFHRFYTPFWKYVLWGIPENKIICLPVEFLFV